MARKQKEFKVSDEVEIIDGMEGKLTDIVKAFLDAKKAKYSIAKAKPGQSAVYMKDVSPFVEEGSVVIEKNGKKVIIEELTKVCGMSGRFHERNGVSVDSILDRQKRILFKTRKGKKDLYIHTNLEAKEPTFGMYIGGGEMTINLEDVLDEPSNIPENDETYEINCDCHGLDGLKCKGRVWRV